MEEDEERSAGAIIIKDLDLLEKANAFRRAHIEPEIWIELGRAFEHWAISENWAGGYTSEDFYIAPRHWVPDGEMFIAWFEVSYDGDEDTSQLAKLTGCGEGQLAIRFTTSNDIPGGSRRAYGAFEKSAEFSGIVKRLAALGFVHSGRGRFHIPISISSDVLLAAWLSRDYSTALADIGPTLERALGSVEIFDQILAAVAVNN